MLAFRTWDSIESFQSSPASGRFRILFSTDSPHPLHTQCHSYLHESQQIENISQTNFGQKLLTKKSKINASIAWMPKKELALTTWYGYIQCFVQLKLMHLDIIPWLPPGKWPLLGCHTSHASMRTFRSQRRRLCPAHSMAVQVSQSVQPEFNRSKTPTKTIFAPKQFNNGTADPVLEACHQVRLTCPFVFLEEQLEGLKWHPRYVDSFILHRSQLLWVFPAAMPASDPMTLTLPSPNPVCCYENAHYPQYFYRSMESMVYQYHYACRIFSSDTSVAPFYLHDLFCQYDAHSRPTASG